MFSKYLTQVIQSTGNRSFRDEQFIAETYHVSVWTDEKKKIYHYKQRPNQPSPEKGEGGKTEIKIKNILPFTRNRRLRTKSERTKNRGPRARTHEKKEKCGGNIYRQFFPRFLSIRAQGEGGAGEGGDIVYNRATNTARDSNFVDEDGHTSVTESWIFRVSRHTADHVFHRRGPATCTV